MIKNQYNFPSLCNKNNHNYIQNILLINNNPIPNNIFTNGCSRENSINKNNLNSNSNIDYLCDKKTDGNNSYKNFFENHISNYDGTQNKDTSNINLNNVNFTNSKMNIYEKMPVKNILTTKNYYKSNSRFLGDYFNNFHNLKITHNDNLNVDKNYNKNNLNYHQDFSQKTAQCLVCIANQQSKAYDFMHKNYFEKHKGNDRKEINNKKQYFDTDFREYYSKNQEEKQSIAYRTNVSIFDKNLADNAMKYCNNPNLKLRIFDESGDRTTYKCTNTHDYLNLTHYDKGEINRFIKKKSDIFNISYVKNKYCDPNTETTIKCSKFLFTSPVIDKKTCGCFQNNLQTYIPHTCNIVQTKYIEPLITERCIFSQQLDNKFVSRCNALFKKNLINPHNTNCNYNSKKNAVHLNKKKPSESICRSPKIYSLLNNQIVTKLCEFNFELSKIHQNIFLKNTPEWGFYNLIRNKLNRGESLTEIAVILSEDQFKIMLERQRYTIRSNSSIRDDVLILKQIPTSSNYKNRIKKSSHYRNGNFNDLKVISNSHLKADNVHLNSERINSILYINENYFQIPYIYDKHQDLKNSKLNYFNIFYNLSSEKNDTKRYSEKLDKNQVLPGALNKKRKEELLDKTKIFNFNISPILCTERQQRSFKHSINQHVFKSNILNVNDNHSLLSDEQKNSFNNLNIKSIQKLNDNHNIHLQKKMSEAISSNLNVDNPEIHQYLYDFQSNYIDGYGFQYKNLCRGKSQNFVHQTNLNIPQTYVKNFNNKPKNNLANKYYKNHVIYNEEQAKLSVHKSLPPFLNRKDFYCKPYIHFQNTKDKLDFVKKTTEVQNNQVKFKNTEKTGKKYENPM
ncbi:hypothetical protein EDEG_00515 [Edhazardia aedis USNM 41457]|uniref:Uncharacterized protein n=1 Tax=Edhazardia aedis (strain USNM 41457) TaxID=1003232 RepID=J8ZNN4_EDHAE|nr:hypothetical protein EDEG_00515 [Edhazardia aedis USNM 41457]|eukprot:EJW01298.1 hypothetical protein EDEG_00515 [Edhazardia aedis USNM 41457]